MLILLTIFLLIIIPLVMVIVYAIRPRFSIQGFLAVLAVLAGWSMVLLAKAEVPQQLTLLVWEPASFFPNSPTLLLDDISWYFAISLMSLTLGLIITSIAQIGQSRKPPANGPTRIEVNEVRGLPNPITQPTVPIPVQDGDHSTSWQSWGGMLVLTSMGLVGVAAGNLLTLVLAWTALDIAEVIILMAQTLESKLRERIVLGFSARMAGIALVILTGINSWSQGIQLSYESVSQSTSIFLILAAGLRLGVIPLQVPLIQQLPSQRGLGTALRLIPLASSLILLVRISETGVLGPALPFLLIFISLAGFYNAIQWLYASDELKGRPYWLLGTASLAIAAAILNQPLACLVWSLASVLTGGLVFSMSLRHKNLVALVILGVFNFSTLPISPTWLGTLLYQNSSPVSAALSSVLFYSLSIIFILIHAILLAGLIRHLLRDIYPASQITKEHIERWVWFFYPVGLVFISVTHLVIGLLLIPALREVPTPGWIAGIISIVISVIILFLFRRYAQKISHTWQKVKVSPVIQIASLGWIYRIVWQVYRFMVRLTALLSTILEGEGGILWALVLFALIFVFLQR